MTVFRQGDVLATAKNEGFELALVFGHLGYSLMDQKWREFSDGVDFWQDVVDPFAPGFAGRPHEYTTGRWVWFFKGGLSQGMSDAEFKDSVEVVFEWATKQALRRVITNGINDIDHGRDTDLNRASDDRRTDFLISILKNFEESDGFDSVHLISLNDVFIRRCTE